ncbi:MAG TPA: hypothetical protein VJX94_13450, partial [Stellaceae bacterium]|nr:hypothetical protein [Stellaceae bacterium]
APFRGRLVDRGRLVKEKAQPGEAMPTVARIGAIQIRFYYEDHGAPHFYAISPNFDFKFAIADCSIISATAI